MGIYIRNNRLIGSKVTKRTYPIDRRIIPTHINSTIAQKLLNKNASTSLALYSSRNPYGGVGDAGVWVRNPSCWLNGVNNISCFSPAQRSGANWFQRGATLITKKHFIHAKHFKTAILPNGGTPIIFVDENNNAIKRNLIQYADDFTDITIGLLDSEVPSNIKIAKVLPPDYLTYIEADNLNKYSLGHNQFGQVFVNKTTLGFGGYIVNNGSGGTVNIPNIFVYNLSSTDPYYSFTKTVIVGDSGQPSFVIIDNDLVLLTCWWAPTSGPFVSTRYDRINELINNLSPNEGYSLSPVDLALIYHKYS